MAKQISVAKQGRERALMEFHAASDDLEEELQKTPVNVRRIKSKLQLLKVSYDSVVIAQSEVVTLEKTSASDEANRNWVKEKLRKPFVSLSDRAEDVLEATGEAGDLEAQNKLEAEQEKKTAKLELSILEVNLTATIDGLQKAIDDTNIWLPENHKSLLDGVNTAEEDLTRKHTSLASKLLSYLVDAEANTEDKRQTDYRANLLPVLASVKTKLWSKTPSAIRSQSVGAAPVSGSAVLVGTSGSQMETTKAKMKLTAMPVPKFSGRVVDYPEWKKLFQDCVQSQYEDSATLMTLRSQALPDSLVSLVPRCGSIDSVWEKLDKKFLDPNRVWKGVKADLKGLDRSKLGDCKYMVALVNKLLDAENILETVNMVHWLRQDDKIPEYEDFLSKSEKLEWVRMKPKLLGTPWKNFKTFLVKMRDEYEDMAKTGTVDLVEEIQTVKPDKSSRCSNCKKKGHTEDNCWSKNGSSNGGDSKRKCFKCGDDDHIAKDCQSKIKILVMRRRSYRIRSNLVKTKKTFLTTYVQRTVDGVVGHTIQHLIAQVVVRTGLPRLSLNTAWHTVSNILQHRQKREVKWH